MRAVLPIAMMNARIASGDVVGALAAAEQTADDRSPGIFWVVGGPLSTLCGAFPGTLPSSRAVVLPERY
jgi:hypothetical protein